MDWGSDGLGNRDEENTKIAEIPPPSIPNPSLTSVLGGK